MTRLYINTTTDVQQTTNKQQQSRIVHIQSVQRFLNDIIKLARSYTYLLFHTTDNEMESTDPPTLPPQMFTTSAQLLDLTDKKLMIALRDGRKLIGVLRAWDQYANLVLQSTTERIFVDGMYCDIPRGVYIVRGENVLLLGEIDLDREDDIPFRQATVQELFSEQRREQIETKKREKVQRRKLRALGFEDEGEVLL